MTKTINGRLVPDALYNEAKAAIESGGKAWLATAEGGYGCTNCEGAGSLVLQYQSGDAVGSQSPSGQGLAFLGDAWRNLKTSVFKCPTCQYDS